MRYAIMVAAFGLMMGAPTAVPANFVNVAFAQDEVVLDALAAELAAVANDPAAIAAIITRERAAGNVNGLATSLAAAARSVAATNVAGAAALVTQAVTVAEGASPEVQEDVGQAASSVANTAVSSGDVETAAAVQVAVATSASAEIQISYVNSQSNTPAPEVQQQPQQPQQQPQRPTVPPVPEEPDVPEIPEPNPSQAGSPT